MCFQNKTHPIYHLCALEPDAKERTVAHNDSRTCANDCTIILKHYYAVA